MKDMALRRTHGGQWVETAQVQGAILPAQVPAIDEAFACEIEHQDAVKTGRRQKDLVLRDADFMTMLQKRVAERVEHHEILVEQQELRIGGNQNPPLVKSDAAQPAIAASPGDVDLCRVPVEFQLRAAASEIDEIQSAMALPMARAANDGRGEE